MEHPDNYQTELQQREIERKTKDVVDKREIGVIEEANAAAQEVYDGTVKGDDGKPASGDYEITLKKGETLPLNGSVSLKLTKDTSFEVVGASTPEIVAGELAAVPSIYGAIRDDLAHDEKFELPDGRKGKRKITYGVGGVKMIGEETVDGVDTTDAALVSGGDVSDEATAKRADNILHPPEPSKPVQNTVVAESPKQTKTKSTKK